MSLQKETIESFKKLIREERGMNISFDEAEEVLRTWVAYYDLLAKIYHQEKQNDENIDDNWGARLRVFWMGLGFRKYEKGAKLIRLVELVYKPMTEEEYQKLQERRKKYDW